MNSMIEQMLLQHEKADVLPFIRNPASLDAWSAELFQDMTRQLMAK